MATKGLSKEEMDLYSRQIASMGLEAMMKLTEMRVLLVGLKGLGIETAKNLTLAGPGEIGILDNEPVAMQDLGANFFLAEADVGKPRAAACLPKLQELNPRVKLRALDGELTEEVVGKYSMVVFTEGRRDDMIRWDDFCRNNSKSVVDSHGKVHIQPAPIPFIAAATMGAMGYIFSDFGDNFTVTDGPGNPMVSRTITGITNAEKGIIQLVKPEDSELARQHDIDCNDHTGYVTFSEVKGMYCHDEKDLDALGHSLNTSGAWRVNNVEAALPEQTAVPGEEKVYTDQFYVYQRNSEGKYLKFTDEEMEKNQAYCEKVDNVAMASEVASVLGHGRKDNLKPVVMLECFLKNTEKSPHKFYNAAGEELNAVPEEDIVRDADGEKMKRMTRKRDFYKLEIGDTRGYSPYITGGVFTQHLEPEMHHHKSLSEALQQPIGIGQKALLSMDDDKDGDMGKNYWYGGLHLAKVAIFQFEAKNGRKPEVYNDADADEVVQLAKDYNKSMRALHEFCGPKSAYALPDLDLAEPRPELSEDQKQLVKDLKATGCTDQNAEIALAARDWNIDMAQMLLMAEMFGDMDGAAEFNELTTRLPNAWNAHKILTAIRKVALTCAAELQPVACFFGGIVAQEIVKFGGKYVPMNQWGHFDCLEVLPSSKPADTAKQDCRYDHTISVFGKDVQDKLLNTRTWMVGCGALGCELMKNFALLGIACGNDGMITVTDGDAISVSNLNRQFLFRDKHVGLHKTECAAETAKVMNPSINIHPLTLLAMPATENTFGDDFFAGSGLPNDSEGPPPDVKEGNGLDFVVNALDSVIARKYVDSRCVYFNKPLLESGTEGTKFNTMVILPNSTVSYDEGEPEPAGETIPMCTVRSFPSTMTHCIEWTRGEFNDRFESDIDALNKFVEEGSLKGKSVDELKEEIEMFMADANEVSQCISAILPSNDRSTGGPGLLKSFKDGKAVKEQGFKHCVQMAVDLFYMRYNHAVRDLIHQNPKDSVTSSGKPFWAPPKRFPTPAEVDTNNPLHMAYITSCANLYAVAYGIQPLPIPDNVVGGTRSGAGTVSSPHTYTTAEGKLYANLPDGHEWRSIPANMVQECVAKTPAWEPTKAKIDTGDGDEEDNKDAGADDGDDMERIGPLLDELVAASQAGVTPQVADFEKDIDINFHIDFVAAASNMRANVYGIAEEERHKIKSIAGKIIAAIATSTASATGLVCIELLKLVQGKEKAEFRSASCNYAVNMFQMEEPKPTNVIEGEGIERVVPDPLEIRAKYGDDGFDAAGEVKDEHVQLKKWKAYPSPHNKWQRLEVPRGTTMEGLQQFFQEVGITLDSLAVKDGKTGFNLFGQASVTGLPATDWAKEGIDTAVLVEAAPLDLNPQQATAALMRFCMQDGPLKGLAQKATTAWKDLQPEKMALRGTAAERTVADVLSSEGKQDLAGRSSIALNVTLAFDEETEARTPTVVLLL